eukprot:12568856-Ditylum_brightwellii.AAC.1
METGLVSPQFHVVHDDFFETARASSENPLVMSKWQTLSGMRQLSKVPYAPVARSPRSQRPTRQQLMPSSEGEVPANNVRTAMNNGGIGQATEQLPVAEPNQHLQDGMREEEMGISD